MSKWSKFLILGGFAITLLGLGGIGCGNDCGEGETEVCSDFQTFDGTKNGFIGECVCVAAECIEDIDCEPGFFCDGGLCVAE